MNTPLIPGQVRAADGHHELNAGRRTRTVIVTNDGDRPIQVGSHFHFFEVNPALHFEREATRGYRLAIAAGTSVRFEPGASRGVTLVELGGTRYIAGLQIEDTRDD